ncbi:MAG: hypothetical protein U9P38_06100 [Campylobacterota bacterium]|nr:hypothetical protein [Campylobacterota bacterium]
MLYIVTALKSEAQAFVEKYSLKQEKLGKYKIFKNKNIILIIGGIGVYSARLATQTLINQFDITDDDIYLNVGICGADRSFEIGELIEIGSIVYEEQNYEINRRISHKIYCSDEEVSTDNHTLVDMESFGFYDAVVHSTAIKKSFIFKVVSDHFEPETITKDMTKSLLFNKIDDINKIIFR